MSSRASTNGAAAPIRVVLADDHEVVRAGLRLLLDQEGDIRVVGEARDGRGAVRATRTLGPDVVVMDVGMPRLNGLEATRQIVDEFPGTRVLALSAHADEEYVQRALEVGAVGYVLKQAPLCELAHAIRHARRGEVYLSPSLNGSASGSDPAARSGTTPRAPPPRLTVREAEVLQLVAEGKANKESAAELGISVKTVEKHRQSLMNKLDIHDVAGLTRFAVARGVVRSAWRPSGG